MFGPMFGGLLAGTDVETANFMLPALAAAGLTVLALGYLIAVLPESLKVEHRTPADGKVTLPFGEQLRTAFGESHVRDAVGRRVPGLRRVVVAVIDFRVVDEPRARPRAARHRPDLHVLRIHRHNLSARPNRTFNQVDGVRRRC